MVGLIDICLLNCSDPEEADLIGIEAIIFILRISQVEKGYGEIDLIPSCLNAIRLTDGNTVSATIPFK